MKMFSLTVDILLVPSPFLLAPVEYSCIFLKRAIFANDMVFSGQFALVVTICVTNHVYVRLTTVNTLITKWLDLIPGASKICFVSFYIFLPDTLGSI